MGLFRTQLLAVSRVAQTILVSAPLAEELNTNTCCFPGFLMLCCKTASVNLTRLIVSP